MVSEYWGETGRSAHHRFLKHQEEVVKKDEGNAFAKHLAIHHPEAQGDMTVFNIRVVSLFKKPLPRKKTEALKIQTSKADFLMNSKNELKQPAQHRVVRTRENEDLDPASGRKREGSRGKGGRWREEGGRSKCLTRAVCRKC